MTSNLILPESLSGIPLWLIPAILIGAFFLIWFGIKFLNKSIEDTINKDKGGKQC